MTSDVRALDAGDDGFHEIQLNGKQLVFLGMATTLVSVVIFLCGVLVGRGVKPIDTVAQAAGPQTFDTPVTPAAAALTAVAPGTISTPSPAPPAPTSGKSTAAAAAAAAPGEDDTQPTPVGDDPDAGATPETAAAAAPPAVEPRTAAKATSKVEAPKPAAKPSQATVVPPAVKPVTPPAPAAAPKPAPAPAMAATAPATSNGAIAVQVGAFKTRGEADTLAKRLSGKGYAVYVMSPTGDGKPVYRVRVGNYATADEAKNVSVRLTQQEKLKPWITR